MHSETDIAQRWLWGSGCIGAEESERPLRMRQMDNRSAPFWLFTWRNDTFLPSSLFLYHLFLHCSIFFFSWHSRKKLNGKRFGPKDDADEFTIRLPILRLP